MKIINHELLEEVFSNIKEVYPGVEKIWYDSQNEEVLFNVGTETKGVSIKDLVHDDVKLANLIFNELLDHASVYYSEYIGTSKYEEKSCLKDDTEFLKKYIKLGLLFTYFIDEMLDGYDYMVLEDKYKSLEIDGTVCFEENAYKFLKEFLEERKKVHDFKKGRKS